MQPKPKVGDIVKFDHIKAFWSHRCRNLDKKTLVNMTYDSMTIKYKYTPEFICGRIAEIKSKCLIYVDYNTQYWVPQKYLSKAIKEELNEFVEKWTPGETAWYKELYPNII